MRDVEEMDSTPSNSSERRSLKRTSRSSRRTSLDADCPVEKHGGADFDLCFRGFLPERYDVDVEQRFKMNKFDALGEGGYGKVFLAKDKECEDREVAIKYVHAPRSVDLANLRQEISIMKDLDHPNICKLLAVFEKAGQKNGRDMYFVMELCQGGELFDRIIENKYVSESLSADIISQVSSALAYAHGRTIAHRDIKPENVVFCTKDRADTHVKVIDWGLATSFKGKGMKCSVGSFTYAAPEVIMAADRTVYTQACDLWSLGVLTYVMLCGSPPFWGNHKQFLRAAKNETYPMHQKPWPLLSGDSKDFVRRLLKADPQKRLTIQEVCLHPWLKKASTEDDESMKEAAIEVLTNLKHFCNASSFARMCITSVARQLDHKHLKGIHKVFRELDQDGNGVLCKKEIEEGFKKIFGEDSKEVLQWRETFECLDLNGSEEIDYTEFCAAGLSEKMALQEDAIWAAFKAFDLDNSGAIELKDIARVLDVADVQDAWTSEVCHKVGGEILDMHDQDGDGKIDYEDWKKLMQAAWEGHLPEEEDEAGIDPASDVYDLLTSVSSCQHLPR